LRFGKCIGYILGVFDTISAFKVCPPQTTQGQTKAVFIAWAHRNPQKWNELAVGGVVIAFQEA
jgi:hypothetical protein